MKFLLYALMLCSGITLQAQTILAEDELTYYYRLGLEEAAASDPDSVFALRIYGNYNLDEEEPEDYISEDIFRYRNLQVLEIISSHAEHIVNRINDFPLLQYLLLENVAMSNLPPAIYDLGNLHILKLADFGALHFDTLFLTDNQIHELSLDECESYCPETDEICEHQLGLFPELRRFTMHGNEYTLPESLFSLAYLEELDISNCQVSNIEGVESMYTLRLLNISRNGNLEELPYYIGDLENLEVLWAEEVPLIELPETITMIGTLRELTATGTSISYLPDNIGDLILLERLQVSSTQLSELPESFQNLESLLSLNLADNQLSAFPTTVCKLANLHYLTLDRNQMHNIPACINNMQSLMQLSMEGNHFSTFEHGIFQMPNLEFLDLTYCNMGKMPPGLNGLTNLKNLEMEWCGIREFDPAVLSLGNLDYLNLEGNEISTLPAKGWKGMRTLRNLQLQQNKLSALPKDINQLGALTYIDLSSNQLKALPKGFSKLGSLQSMYLAGNKDIKIPKEIKKMHLEVIYLKTGDLNAKALANLKKWVGAEVVQVTDY